MDDIFFQRKSINGIKKTEKVSQSTLLILDEAEKHNIEWKKIPFCDLFELTYNCQSKFFHGQVPSTTTELAYYCCDNKRISNNLLEKSGLSVSNGYRIEFDDKKQYRLNLFEDLIKPLVIKPVDDCQGKNVYLNITAQKEYLDATQKIYDFYGQQEVEIAVEEMFQGDEYRILATQEKILSVIKRIPANVVGDGKSTVKQLIEEKNLDPIREKIEIYKQIQVDEEVLEFLNNQDITLNSVVAEGETVFLRPHSPLDISLGGDTIDITDKIHPTVNKIVSKIMQSIPGLALTGIDYMTTDICKEQTADNYRIIELNSSPSLHWNEFPIVGPRRRVAYEFLKIMFPTLGELE